MGPGDRRTPRRRSSSCKRRLRRRRVTYYAVFHAVTALFALDGRIFTKHAALEAVVHRDLVKDGKWTSELGRDFSFCVELRGLGDYASEVRIDAKQATDAIASARRILVAVRDALPVDFPPVPRT